MVEHVATLQTALPVTALWNTQDSTAKVGQNDQTKIRQLNVELGISIQKGHLARVT